MDLIFMNGKVLTISAGRAEALAVREGRIQAVGRTSEIKRLAGPKTEIIDLEGKALMPGFIDAHMHLASQGLKATGYLLDLSQAHSLEEALELVRQAVHKRGEGAWVLGQGWDESLWPEKRYLTKVDLDRVAPHSPVALSRVDGHLMVVNSQALKLMPLQAGSNEFDQAQGLLKGRAAERFLAHVQPEPEELEEAILAAIKMAHSLGITAVHDVVRPEHIKAYQRLKRLGKLRLRVRLNPVVQHLDSLIGLGFSTGFGDSTLKLGAIKVFADGSIGARNAALLEPYADASETLGQLNHPQEELNALVRKAHENGFQLMIHAIGDRAIGSALEALKKAGIGPEDRARIEHLELPTEEELEEAQELGIIASMQPNFLKWSGPGRLYEARLGKERDARIDPHRAVVERDIPLAFGSDGMPFGPLYGIHLAVNAPHPGQRLSVEEALKAYTLGAAYAGFSEEDQGSLEPGKWADLIVLAEDPNTHPEGIKEIKVLETYLGGERVFLKQGRE